MITQGGTGRAESSVQRETRLKIWEDIFFGLGILRFLPLLGNLDGQSEKLH